jgi:N4-gp56 family major capsid protein
MSVQTTSNLSNAQHAQYMEEYIRGAKLVRLYDNFAKPIGKDMGTYTKGSSVVVNFLGDMNPGTETIPENADVTPSTTRDATASMTWESRWGALQASEKLLNSSSTNYGMERYFKLGKNQMETVDNMAKDVCTQGSFWGSYAMTARTSLDAGTNYYLNGTVFANAQAHLQTLKVPGTEVDGVENWLSVIHPYAHADLRKDTYILAVGEYQDKSIILGHELGKLGPFRILNSAWAKVFWSGGIANGTPVATTLATSTTANIKLATTIEVAINTNITAGDWLTIGTLESGSTNYPTNERVRVLAIPSGTTVTIAGEADNGGLRFDHSVGETVSNADSVGTAVFGGPQSIAKLYDVNMDNEYGTTGGPIVGGMIEHLEHIYWKWYGNYKLMIQPRIYRYEHTFSVDA